MNVDLTRDQQAFVRQGIESGRFRREEDAGGEGIPITEDSMKALAERVKQRGRARLDAERPTSR
jgi:Arc/MetJ-type ribon-helix-helix transcriptional regulator